MKSIRAGAAGAIFFLGALAFALAWALSEIIEGQDHDQPK